MVRLSLWNATKGNDFRLFDNLIAEQFRIGGTAFLIHKYLGIHEQEPSDDLTLPNDDIVIETNIQDLLYLENRDRKYDPNVYELRGGYNVQDNDFDLSQFGLFLSSDVLYIEFHLRSMIESLGRKIMAGDVLELPHQRDDALLSDDPDCGIAPAIPKLYKVEDANRATSGYSPTWYPHIWRVKISPLTDSQEFRDIIGDGDRTDDLKNIISTFNVEMKISDAIVAEAERQVPNRNLEHSHLFVMPENENGIPYLFLTDGIPPNGAELLGKGNEFPSVFNDGDWFLRTDYEPNVLFKREGTNWIRKEVDYRKKWQAANRILEEFINNRNKTNTQQGEVDSKVAISKAVATRKRPPVDLE